jgi:hypothetical protein
MSITVCKCGATEANKLTMDQHLLNVSSGSAVTVDPDTTIGLNIRYVVIPFGSSDSQGNISDANISAQHQVIVSNFQTYQGDFKNVGQYKFEDLFGNPRILFFPQDYTQVITGSAYIERMNVPSSPPVGGYASFADVQTEYLSQGGTMTPGTMIVFITTLSNGGGGQLLGEAGGIPYNACTVHFGTVGSETVPGPFAIYDFGAGTTLIHELGHCLGLYHPFETGSAACVDANSCCAAAQIYHDSYNPQSALQYNPNNGGQVFLSNLDSGTNAWDNRGRDLLLSQSPGCVDDTPPSTTCGLKSTDAPTPVYSCADYEGQSLTDPATVYESFVIFMDYASDSSRIGFFSYTTELMRSVLLNNPQLFTVSVFPNGSIAPIPVPTPASSGGLSTGAIIGIVLGVTFGVLALVLILYYTAKAKK